MGLNSHSRLWYIIYIDNVIDTHTDTDFGLNLIGCLLDASTISGFIFFNISGGGWEMLSQNWNISGKTFILLLLLLLLLLHTVPYI